MGMHFPAGKELEKLALTAEKAEKLPLSVDGAYMSFSGPETKAARLADTVSAPSLAKGVLENVAAALTKSINNAIKETDIHRILIVGGVASNTIIRKTLTEKLDGDVYFASPEYSSDNAVGTAYLAYTAGKEV
jgi:N6-L-threonylcarbamoyladenine synthase